SMRADAVLGQPLSTIEAVPVANGLHVPERTRAQLEGVVHDLRARTAPGEPIFVYPTSPLLYVAADRPNPTRYAHLYPGAASRSQLERLIADLDRAGVKVVVVDDAWRSAWGPAGDNQVVEAYLAAHFQ